MFVTKFPLLARFSRRLIRVRRLRERVQEILSCGPAVPLVDISALVDRAQQARGDKPCAAALPLSAIQPIAISPTTIKRLAFKTSLHNPRCFVAKHNKTSLMEQRRVGGYPETMLEKLQQRARTLKREVHALYLAARDPRTPWYAKAIIAGVVAYALSPIDLVPDFIPILGYLDDLLLLPVGIYLALQLIPGEVLTDARRRAAETSSALPKRWAAALVIVALWLVALVAVGIFIARAFNTELNVLVGG